jgi:hypothetical protein
LLNRTNLELLPLQCETAEEEANLISSHMRAVEERLRESADAKTSTVADAMVRAMAAHTLGYAEEVRFAHIYALQLAQKGSILEKKMGECDKIFLDLDYSL